jgi:hypothetical protein
MSAFIGCTALLEESFIKAFPDCVELYIGCICLQSVIDFSNIFIILVLKALSHSEFFFISLIFFKFLFYK